MDKLTIEDIARLAGVSRATVSRVINGQNYVAAKTKEKIDAVIRDKHFVPNAIAQGLKTSSRSVGVISLDITNQYFTSIIYSIEKKLRDSKYMMYYLNSDNDREIEEKCLVDLISKRVDGIILLSTMFGKGSQLIGAVRDSVPIVVVEGFLEGMDTVNTNNAEGANAAMEYLFRCGHRRIAFCANTLDVESYKTRFKSYHQMMRKYAAEYADSYHCVGSDYVERLQEKMEGPERPTAVFCTNDSHAFKVYEYCYDQGYQIPRDLSVIGFDNLPIAKLVNPRLTTVSIPVKYMGEMAAQLLIDRMASKCGEERGFNIEVPTALKERDSVARL